ncbi:LEM-3-like GIY-YIG domain-containing protein [Marinifilum flexuosum]|uniref:GIY-YIG domain-containing protein n=1 Tax=Marinifilum flexuosum TaxID=1117708 RepID=A0A419X381_9BACT|nr:hypothetical protein [Marinifilum flexuosum]RKE02079.1 hypothetical protein BXY64_2160 [Marinifilum flexuosum]
MFDEKTCEILSFYVYLLVDPETNEPFYVGKGKENRVFAHINLDIKENTENLKYQEIQRIGSDKVKHVIVRHGLSESAAFAVEASLIDTFRYIPSFNTFVKGNIQGGVNSIENGLMTSDEIISIYNAEPLKVIDDNCLIININKNYKKGAGVEAIYNATKETWKMAEWRPPKYCYVLSEYRGLIREVFKIKEWYTKERLDKYGNVYLGYGFNGEVADIDTRNKYINKTIQGIKPQGYGYPTVYPETLREWVSKIEN